MSEINENLLELHLFNHPPTQIWSQDLNSIEKKIQFVVVNNFSQQYMNQLTIIRPLKCMDNHSEKNQSP